MSRIINIAIFAITLPLVVLLFFKDGRFRPDRARKAFRFFTVQSNAFCAVAALLMCLWPGQRWVWIVKYIGTAAVTVTLLTVFLFLGPSSGGYGALLRGSDFFMYLVTPLLAIVSFGFFERRGMGFAEALWGMLPVVCYGLWYLYKTIYAPESRRWEDFYGYNKGGKWPV